MRERCFTISCSSSNVSVRGVVLVGRRRRLFFRILSRGLFSINFRVDVKYYNEVDREGSYCGFPRWLRSEGAIEGCLRLVVVFLTVRSRRMSEGPTKS